MVYNTISKDSYKLIEINHINTILECNISKDRITVSNMYYSTFGYTNCS